MSWVGVGALVLSAASTAYQTNQQRRQAKSAEAANQRQAEAMRQAELQEQQNFNRQNRNTADVGALRTRTRAASARRTSRAAEPAPEAQRLVQAAFWDDKTWPWIWTRSGRGSGTCRISAPHTRRDTVTSPDISFPTPGGLKLLPRSRPRRRTRGHSFTMPLRLTPRGL